MHEPHRREPSAGSGARPRPTRRAPAGQRAVGRFVGRARGAGAATRTRGPLATSRAGRAGPRARARTRARFRGQPRARAECPSLRRHARCTAARRRTRASGSERRVCHRPHEPLVVGMAERRAGQEQRVSVRRPRRRPPRARRRRRRGARSRRSPNGQPRRGRAELGARARDPPRVARGPHRPRSRIRRGRPSRPRASCELGIAREHGEELDRRAVAAPTRRSPRRARARASSRCGETTTILRISEDRAGTRAL